MNEKALATLDKPIEYNTESGKVVLSINQVKKFVAKGSTDVTMNEAIMFMQLCKFNALNPWIGDAYLIKYGKTATMVTSKYAYMKRAERAGDRYEGFKAGIVVLPKDWGKNFVEEGKAPEPIYREGTLSIGMEIIGGWAEVYVLGRKFPIRAEIDFNEFVQRKTGGEINSMWTNKPGTMIRKCALVGAMREAFPDVFGNLVSEEELPEIPTDAAPSFSPEGEILDVDTTTGEVKIKKGETDKKEPPARRARRHNIDLDGATIKTCGITALHYKSIANSEAKDETLKRLIDDYLQGVGANDLTFLRKEEGAELLKLIMEQGGLITDTGDETETETTTSTSSSSTSKGPLEEPGHRPGEQKPETEDKGTGEEETPKEDPKTEPGDQKTGKYEKIPCPDRGDIDVELSWCEDQCPKFTDKTCKLFAD